MEQLPVRIYKHWIGYVIIALAGLCVIGIFWSGLGTMLEQTGINQMLVLGIAALAILSTAAISIVLIYVYGLSYVELTENGITVKNWVTPFTSRDEQSEWVRVTRSNALIGGIFGRVLNYGTLSVETNGGSNQVRFTYLPRPEHWQYVIQLEADNATPDVPTVS
ncbi:hypothetical protein [Curtobacterium sp. MCSS17_007]|uniref:hypothetical protein n=1 Tax=Curtobacterium sp. MCSS17_007 TaxID=2175646 RepID=UPI000DAA29D3|nr:hypothetical protein [Curtobacterium sp. MCSS17_007]WIE74504.1 hypothetical protein DEJ22_009435 [Curtobacterium sp. MCSS17_007]